MTVNDASLVTKVKMALATDERSALTDVLVEAVDGIVYLRGQVESQTDMEAAVQVTSDVPGVTEVRSHLSVMEVREPTTVRLDLPESRPFAEEGQ